MDQLLYWSVSTKDEKMGRPVGSKPDSPHCFNCHSQLPGGHNSNSGPARGITVIKNEGDAANTLISYSEALTYIFELQPTDIDRLYQLGLDDDPSLTLCDCCTSLLATVYSTRLQFAALTSRNSFLYNILSAAKECVSPFPEVEENVGGWEDDLPAEEGHDDQEEFNESDGPDLDGLDPLQVEPLQFKKLEAVSPVREYQLRCRPERGRIYLNQQCQDTGHEIAVRQTKRKPAHCRHICEICGRPFYKKSGLERHLLTHLSSHEKASAGIPKPRVKCPECDKSFAVTTDKVRLQWHLQTVHGRRDGSGPLIADVCCDICGKPISPWESAIIHRITHLNAEERLRMGPQEAEAVKKKTTWLEERRRRIALRRQQKTTGACPKCGKVLRSFNIELAIKRHTELVHNKSCNICEICGKPNYNKTALNLHVTTHMSVEEKAALLPPKQRSLCAECGASFSEESTLKDHIARVHEGRPKKRLNCDECEYTATGRALLRAHKRRHEIEASDETPFSCSKCPAKFKTKKDLKYHPPACPAEAASRPHLCLEVDCGRRFRYKHEIELHLNEFHKYGPIKARELIYPGLPVKPSSLHKKKKAKKRMTNEDKIKN